MVQQAPTNLASHSAATATTETIHTTANHPWLTADRGWVAAGELRPGESVVTLSGGTSTVAWVQVVPGQANYYTLTVAKDHTYAVGYVRAVVHNDTCFGPNDPSQAADRQRIGFARRAAAGEKAGVWVMDENGRPFTEESSGPAVSSRYGPATMYNTADGAGTCAEFRCGAYTGPLYDSNLSRGSELYMYLYHRNLSPPCGSCRNMLTRWAQDNQAPIHVYWLDKNDNLWGQTFG